MKYKLIVETPEYKRGAIFAPSGGGYQPTNTSYIKESTTAGYFYLTSAVEDQPKFFRPVR